MRFPEPSDSIARDAVVDTVLEPSAIVLFVNVCVAANSVRVPLASGTVSVRVVAVVIPEASNAMALVVSELSTIVKPLSNAVNDAMLAPNVRVSEVLTLIILMSAESALFLPRRFWSLSNLIFVPVTAPEAREASVSWVPDPDPVWS